MGLAAGGYAAMGWPVCLGAQPRQLRAPSSDRACSCDRIGCPAPGAHPLSPAWKLQATTDQRVVGLWWGERPQANVLLVTGRTFDVLDVPAAAGLLAIRRLEASRTSLGPV